MAPFDLSIAFLWPCVDVPRLCSPVSSASVVLRMRQIYDVLLEEAFVFLTRKKTSSLNCSLCSECCLFEGREASLRLTLTDFLGFPSADTVSDVASWYIRCKCSFFPVLVGSLERTCLNWPNLVAWDAKDFSRSRTCATDYH